MSNLENLVSNAMQSCIEGYAASVVASIEFELKRELSTEEHQQVYAAVDRDITGIDAAQKEINNLKIKLSDAGCLLVEWKQRVEKAEKERDDLHGILNIERGGSAFESKRTAYIDGMRDKWRERAEKAEAQLIKAEKGEVLVTVSGFTGCGKSAVAGEIEIALLAIGVPVRWTNGDAEKRMTGADYLTALEMYKPHVRIVERNIAGGKWYE